MKGTSLELQINNIQKKKLMKNLSVFQKKKTVNNLKDILGNFT